MKNKNTCLVSDHPFGTYANFSIKLIPVTPLTHTQTCTYQGVKNVSFSENFANILNEISPILWILSGIHGVKRVRIWSYSGLHFSVFGRNTKRYSVSLRIQSECRKIRTRVTLNMDTFYRAICLFFGKKKVFCYYEN